MYSLEFRKESANFIETLIYFMRLDRVNAGRIDILAACRWQRSRPQNKHVATGLRREDFFNSLYGESLELSIPEGSGGSVPEYMFTDQ